MQMLEPLNNAKTRKLKALAQRLDASLKVGKSGLSEGFIQTLNTELDRHELVKVKFADLKERRKELAPELAEKSNSHLVTLVGNVVVLYRPRAESPAVLLP